MSGSAGAAPVRWRQLAWPAPARRMLTGFYAALVTASLFAPPSVFRGVDQAFPHEDKLAHWAVFLALALLVRWSLPARSGPGGPRLVAPAALALYAAAVETLQPALSAGLRQFEWLDLAFNVAGLGVGWWLFPAAIAARGDD